MARNAAFCFSLLAGATVAVEPKGELKFPFHLPDSALSKAQQDNAVLGTRKRFDRHCFDFIFAVFAGHDKMDTKAVSDRMLPLCKVDAEHAKCQTWAADLFIAQENKRNRHDRKAGVSMAGPQSNADWCAELYMAAVSVPAESPSVKLDVHAKTTTTAPKLRGQTAHVEVAHEPTHELIHTAPTHSETSHVEHTHVKHIKHSAKVSQTTSSAKPTEHSRPEVHANPTVAKATPSKLPVVKDVPVQKVATRPEAKNVAISPTRGVATEQAKRATQETKAVHSSAPKPNIVTSAKTAPVKLDVSAAKEKPAGSLKIAPVSAKSAETKPAQTIKPLATKVQEKPAVHSSAPKPNIVASAKTAPVKLDVGASKEKPAASLKIAPVSAKSAETKPAQTMKPLVAAKVQEKPVVSSTTPPLQVATKKAHKATDTQEDECVCFRRGDGQHCSCPPGKNPPLPVDSQGSIIAAKAATELKNASGLNSLWNAFSGAEHAAKGLFSSIQMRWLAKRD